MAQRLIVEVARDGWTTKLQVSISLLDENHAGDGYRLIGPKFNGSSVPVASATLNKRDRDEIRAYLDRADAAGLD